MQLGVRGYLPLSSCIESVVRAVRCIHNGGIAIAPAIAAKIALSLRSPTLTGREIEVLRMIMQGLPDKVIARHLQRSIATAKSHVKAILGKLGAASRAEAVAIARRRGLVPEETADGALGLRHPAPHARVPGAFLRMVQANAATL
jgi:two-component system NarL family response regulator